MSMFLNILNYTLNIVLDFILLFVLRMPVWGAALATCITMMTCTLIAMCPFVFRKLQLHFCRPQFSRKLFKQIISNGSPTFLNNISGRLVSIVMNIALLHKGGPDAVVVYGVMMYCGDIVQPMLFGVCDSLQPAIGYNYGAGRIDRVKQIVKYILIATASISAVSVVLMLILPKVFASMFLQPSELELLSATSRAIRIYALTFITRWFGYAIQSFFSALDKPVSATILSVGNAFVLPLVLIALLWNKGLDGLWFNSPLTSLLVSIIAAIMIIKT